MITLLRRLHLDRRNVNAIFYVFCYALLYDWAYRDFCVVSLAFVTVRPKATSSEIHLTSSKWEYSFIMLNKIYCYFIKNYFLLELNGKNSFFSANNWYDQTIPTYITKMIMNSFWTTSWSLGLLVAYLQQHRRFFEIRCDNPYHELDILVLAIDFKFKSIFTYTV